MKLLLIILFIAHMLNSVSVSCFEIKSDLQENAAHLTKNFFANLQEDPYLKNAVLSEPSKRFIDKQVTNYMALIKQTHGLLEHSLTRRSLPIEDVTTLTNDNAGVYVLEGFSALYSIGVHFPNDIALFQHEEEGNESWYAAVLERKNKNTADDLVIYQLNNSKFDEKTRTTVTNGIKLGVYSTAESMFLIVAENNTAGESFHEKTGIFEYASNKLIKIQSLDSEYASDVILWSKQHQTFMAVSQYMATDNGKITYEVETPIYKWLGKHFDIINHIKTYGARRITSFAIGNSHFLAVANFQNNLGHTNIYSEIFKYSLHLDQFEPYQKILTQAAVDVKHFSFTKRHVTENFLIFANSFDVELDGTVNYETESIVYKYIDDYFIPFQSLKLNNVLEWLPVNGPNGEFVLLVACKFEGVKSFQYDGWKFVESQSQYTHEAFSKGIVSMRSYQFHGKPIIVVANENDYGTMTNIFEATFTRQKMLNQFQDDMLEWCKNSLQSLKSVDFNAISKNVEEAPKQDDSILQLTQNVAFDNVTIENLHVIKPDATDSEQKGELLQIKSILNEYLEELDQIEQQSVLALHTKGINIFHGNVYVKKLILNNNISAFESITVDSINGISISDLLDNTVDINNGFIAESPLEFENVEISNQINPKFCNDYPIDVLLEQSSEQYLPDLIVHGDVVFNEGVLVGGTLNSINVTKETVLLKNGEQSLRNLNVNVATIDKLEAALINNMDMSQLMAMNNQPIQNIINLTVKTALVGGYVNNIDIPTINKFALRASGDQTITHKYSFDSLHVDNINVKAINGRQIPEDLVLIDGNVEYKLNRDIQFTENLTADAAIVARFINNIGVINGKLDLLLADSSDVQYITGDKELNNLELRSPVNLQGKINNSQFKKMNPVITIEEEQDLTGNFVINGDTNIELLLQANELQSSNPMFSVQRLHEKGLPITEPKIPLHLNFAQQLNVQEVYADRINGIDVNTFVAMGSEQQQTITGWKKFAGDVLITGPTRLEIVNGIYLPDLEAGVLKIYGNQTLNGKYHFENVIAHRIFNVKTEFGANIWENVVTADGNELITGTTLIKSSLEVHELAANTIHCASLTNGYDFNTIVNDTAFIDQNVTISSHKNFVELIAERVNVRNLDLNQLPLAIESAKQTFEFDEDIELPYDIALHNIFFNGQFNGITSESFGHQWMSDGNQQVFATEQTFNKITIFGNLLIESGYMNNIRIEDISKNSIKIDEPFTFGAATFSNGLASFSPVTLEGQFESLDLNDIVLSHTKTEQILGDEITFNGDVTIFGEAYFTGLISGVNLTQLCEFTGSENPKSLHINGNVYFAKGPEVYYINEVPVHHILDNAWFTSRETVMTGIVEFDQVLFQDDIIVQGFVDDVKVELISQTYFSKTRDQNVSALLSFEDSVMFGNGVYAKQASVRGDVNGINLDEFTSTALLNDYDQVFESALYLEDFEVQELSGDYLVNELNLQTDAMRYDVNNIVTGKKVVKDVRADQLLIDRNVKVQEVDILWWLQASVLKSGTFRIPGKVSFFNDTVFVNGISSQYLVNGMKFNDENILLKSAPQTITSLKVFHQPLHFKSIKLKGLLNGIDMSDFMHFQAYKGQDTTFTAPMQFDANIVTPNVNVEKLYQGVNTSELIRNITRFASIDNYYDNYQRLLNVSYQFRHSFQAQAYFIDYYMVKQVYQKVDTIIPVTVGDTVDQYLALVVKDGQNYSIQFDRWDNEGEYFHFVEDTMPIHLDITLHYIKGITFQGKHVWYIEYETESPPVGTSPFYKYEGGLFEVASTGLIKIIPFILHNGSQSVLSLILPGLNKECILLLLEENAILYCANQDEHGGTFLSIYQQLTAYNSTEATTCFIQETPYIFIINRAGIQDQASVDIWQFDGASNMFRLIQVIHVTSPNSISTGIYQGSYYLAIASGHVWNAKYAGLLDIRKFDETAQQFESWQDLSLNAPVQVEFAMLPTNEFILYVVTENPAEPLIIYAYEGISQFRKKIVAATIPRTSNVQSFTTANNKHFVLAKNLDEIRVIEAVFKGEKYDI